MKGIVLFSRFIAVLLCLIPAVGGSSAMPVDGVFDVRGYGANGRDDASDAFALQAAIEAAGESGGDRVLSAGDISDRLGYCGGT